ncbi:hypothetical protein SAMN05216198_1003 [Halopseudomonas litoralis]|uniref:Uncharacterized protein n=1 Tax=Halopseudomonas litoralis TaxID=797277 RepID=A0A1H1NT14_9GAMM|nr:hypothetical protein [Halopseudomonas litoralis]SDS02126.1 hypothetical protein SAMN05216198_1003 [Halopseudomonas litoralis]
MKNKPLPYLEMTNDQLVWSIRDAQQSISRLERVTDPHLKDRAQWSINVLRENIHVMRSLV